jgi:DNA adenine methylase
MTMPIRSPLPWIGGKYYSAQRILAAFPVPGSYDTYVELFGGAAHVLIQKPPAHHVEVYNDVDGDLVNFWMHCRDHAAELEARCRTLPYSRELYYAYHKSLFDGTDLEPLERAARWFYVLRSNFTGCIRPSPQGWRASAYYTGDAHSYHTALDLFQAVQARFRDVLIDSRDFAEVFEQHNQRRTLIYVDPPYPGVEAYYRHAFTLADHQRLAALLNQAAASVALSSYPHPLLDDLYPTTKWRRVSWEVAKHSQRGAETRTRATEMLLCNYPAPEATLWELPLPEMEVSA